MQKALVLRFGLTTAEAGYLVVHCRELAERILDGQCQMEEVARVKAWLSAALKQEKLY